MKKRLEKILEFFFKFFRSVEGEKLNLKKRARQVKEEENGEPTVNPYMLFENGTADSTLDTSIESEVANEDEPVLTGSKKRKVLS